jgi:hypothetical protein
LWWKLASAHALLWVAGAGRTGEMRPEVREYLADVHFQLAAQYESARHWRAARRHRQIAECHLAATPPAPPRPAAAMAMPVPQPPTFVDARAAEARWPDDVA